MKKLFFSAVALVAFSGVSMANTIAVEEEKAVDDPKTDFCSRVAADVLTELDPNNDLSPVEANNIYQQALKICLKQVIKVI